MILNLLVIVFIAMSEVILHDQSPVWAHLTLYTCTCSCWSLIYFTELSAVLSSCDPANKVVASYIINFLQPSFCPQNTNSQLRETRSSARPWRTMSSSDFSTLFSSVTRLAVHKHCFPLVQHLHRNSISSRCANTLMLPDLKCSKLYVLFFSTCILALWFPSLSSSLSLKSKIEHVRLKPVTFTFGKYFRPAVSGSSFLL